MNICRASISNCSHYDFGGCVVGSLHFKFFAELEMGNAFGSFHMEAPIWELPCGSFDM